MGFSRKISQPHGLYWDMSRDQDGQQVTKAFGLSLSKEPKKKTSLDLEDNLDRLQSHYLI